jgi:hypothetical protein
MKIVKLKAEGFWRNRTKLPTYSGIYFVYAAKENDKDEVYDERLLYIGEADNIYERHNGTKEKPAKHNHYDDFVRLRKSDEVLKYVTAKYEGSEDKRREIQNALIFRNNPPINEKATKSYDGEDMMVQFSSDNGCAPKNVSIKNGETRD